MVLPDITGHPGQNWFTRTALIYPDKMIHLDTIIYPDTLMHPDTGLLGHNDLSGQFNLSGHDNLLGHTNDGILVTFPGSHTAHPCLVSE
jgi:hypothetical protein